MLHNMTNKKTRFVVISIMILHFSIIAIVMIAEILEYKSKPISALSKYMIAPFDQDWRMFAPPANSNITVIAQFTSYTGNISDKTDWLDMVSPLNEVKRKRPFLSVGTTYISYLLGNSISHIIQTKLAYLDLSSKIDTTNSDSLKKKRTLELNSEKLNYGDSIILYYSKTVYERLATQKQSARADSVHVQWKIVDYSYPRFSEEKYDYFDKENMKIFTLLRPKHNLYTYQRVL